MEGMRLPHGFGPWKKPGARSRIPGKSRTGNSLREYREASMPLDGHPTARAKQEGVSMNALVTAFLAESP